MSDLEPKPQPPSDPIVPPQGPQEIARVALTSKDNPDGTPVDADEEARRLRASRLEIERLAKQHGLQLRGNEPFPADTTPSDLAAEAREEAEKLMPASDANAAAMFRRRTMKVTKGDMTIEATDTTFNVLAPVSAAFKAIVEFARSTLKGKFGLGLKIGKSAVDLSVKAEGSKDG